jgi:hypothetical protein
MTRRLQSVSLSVAMTLFTVEDVTLDHPIRAVICGVFALLNIAAALWPVDEDY